MRQSNWPLVGFADILDRVDRKITLDDTQTYDCVGVRWYGLGTFIRESKLGLDIRRKQQWIIREGDVVYNKLFAWKGAFAIANADVDGCIVSDKFPTYRLDEDQVDSQYLRYYFRTELTARQAQDLSKGAAAISKLTLNPPDFWKLTIPLAPLDEQRRIVARIEGLAALIEEAQELRAKAGEEAEILLASAMSGVFNGLARTVPARKLIEVCTDVTDGTHDTPNYVPEGIPFLTGKNISPSHLDFDDVQYIARADHERFLRHCHPERGDVLVTLIGTIGKAAVVDTDREFSIKNVGLLKPDPRNIESRFLFYYIASPYFREEALAMSKQAVQKFLGLKRLRNCSIPMPPLQEQRRIVFHLDGLQAEAAELTALQDATHVELDALLPSVLDRAFKGDL